MHIRLAEGSSGEGGKAVKLLIIKDYAVHMGLCWLEWQDGEQLQHEQENLEQDKKLFFRLLDFTILNSYTVYESCGGSMTTWNLSSNWLGNSLFYPTKRIMKYTECQMVDPVLQRLKWADLMQNTPFIGWPQEEDVVIMYAKWMVCMLCHASSFGTPSCDANWLYWIWWSWVCNMICPRKEKLLLQSSAVWHNETAPFVNDILSLQSMQ
jgi:hypothetical protein